MGNKKTTYNADKENAVFAKKLRKIAKEKGATQQSLADYIGKLTGESITRQSVGQWFIGATCPPLRTVPLIANFFGVSTDYLLTETETKTSDEIIRAAVDNLGISEKSAENIRAITQSGGNVDTILERDEFNKIVELLNKIKTKIVIDLFWNTRVIQINEIRKFFCNANKQVLKFIQVNYADSIALSINQQAKELPCGAINSEDSVIIWEYCLLQREMRKLLDDVESVKPEYKELFAEYDNSVEEHLKEILVKKENELCNSTAANNNELDQNIKALKQFIDFYHNHIRKE